MPAWAYWVDEAWMRLKIWWMVLRRLPIVRCPACEGAGGRMSGYFEPEWEECWHCWEQTEWLVDSGRYWFVGRVHPLRWPWVKLAVVTGHATFTGWVLCRMGRHDPDEYGFCRRCYEPTDEGVL